MCVKVQLILLLFGVELYYGHSITKIQISNGTDVYEVNELPNKTVQFVNPKAQEPTLREIIYYRVIERPYITKHNDQERITKEADREEPDFDETLRPFTNSQGYQFLDWGAQEEDHPDDNENATIAVNDNDKNKTNDYYDEYDYKVDNDDEEKTKDDSNTASDNDDFNSMEFDEKAILNRYHENDDDVYNNDDYFDEEIDKNNKDKDKDDSNEKPANSIKTDIEDESAMKANETVANDKIDVKDKNVTNDNDHHEQNDKVVDDNKKIDSKNHANDIAMKLRSQLFNSTKEKYHSIQRHHNKPIIVNRRKREINYKNLPEAPVLPDLDLSILPDYLQKMLERRPGVLKTNKHTDNINKLDKANKESDYNLPDPDIEIRNNFNDEEELTKNREEIKHIKRSTRKPEEELQSSKDDKISDFNMKAKLKDMFDSIENTFTKDGKKPRTYGMNLMGNTAEIWNDVAGAPSISVHDPKDNEEDEVIGNPKTNEVDYDNDSTEDNPDNNLNNDLDYYGEMHSAESVSKDKEKAIKNGGTTEKPKELNIDSSKASDLPDVKIDHIEQIPRINKRPEEPESREYVKKLAAPELPDVKIDHIEQIPRINKNPDESESQEYANKLAELELPDLRIEHMEPIPRTYGKTETPLTTEVTTKKLEIRNEENIEAKQHGTETLQLDETTKKPLKKNLEDKIEKSFDNVIKQFKSLEPKRKAVDFDNNEGSKDNINNKSKTYGLNIEGDHGYIWNELNKPGTHVNVGNIENIETTDPSLDVTTKSDIDQDKTLKNQSEPIETTIGFDKTVIEKESKEEPVTEQQDNKVTTEDPKGAIKDENKEGIQDKESVDKEKELNKKNDTKIALDDLLKKDEFWNWLTNWTTTYMEAVEQRNEKFIKNEVARQLKEKNNDLGKNKVEKDDNNERNNEKSNVDRKKTNSTTQNDVAEINSTKDKTKEHIHENNKTSPYNINTGTVYGSAVATDHVTNIFIFYPETETDKSMKKALVLDKEKSGGQVSKKVPANVTFDERLGSHDDDELKPTDDAKEKSPKNETINITAEASTKISNNIENKANNDLKTTTTEANNETNTESNTATTSNDGLTTTDVNNPETEATTKSTDDATETTTLITDKDAIDGLTTTEVNNSKTEAITGNETTTVMTDKDTTDGTVTTESSSKDRTEASTDNTDADKTTVKPDDKSKEAVTTDATETTEAV